MTEPRTESDTVRIDVPALRRGLADARLSHIQDNGAADLAIHTSRAVLDWAAENGLTADPWPADGGCVEVTVTRGEGASARHVRIRCDAIGGHSIHIPAEGSGPFDAVGKMVALAYLDR